EPAGSTPATLRGRWWRERRGRIPLGAQASLPAGFPRRLTDRSKQARMPALPGEGNNREMFVPKLQRSKDARRIILRALAIVLFLSPFALSFRASAQPAAVRPPPFTHHGIA